MTARRLCQARILLLAWALVILAVLLFAPVRAIGSELGGDWISFASGARLLHSGAGQLYDPASQLRTQIDLVGGQPPGGLNPYPLFPLFALVVQPLAALPIQVSTPIWVGLMSACLLASVAVLQPLLPTGWSASMRGLVAASTVLLLPLVDSIGWGQVTPALLLCLALAVRRAAAHGDGIAVGLLLAGVALKPQLVWLVVPVLLVTRSWRTLTGLAIGGAVWASSTVALVGAGGVREWVQELIPAQYVGQTAIGSGLPSMLTAAGLPVRAAFGGAVVVAPLMLVPVWRTRRRLAADLPLAIGIGVALSAVCSPHAFPRDLCLVAVALLLVAVRRPVAGCAAAMAIGVAYLLDANVADAWKGDLIGMAVLVSLAVVWPRAERAAGAADAPSLQPAI